MFNRLRQVLNNSGLGNNTAPTSAAHAPILPVGQRQSAVNRYDVTAFASELDLTRFQVLTEAPVWMTRAERLMLFSLIFCFRPQRYIEIGTFQGGSALIAANAMRALDNDSRIYCVDPEPKIAPEDWAQLESRAQLFQGYSPQILREVAAAAGGTFDFALIDGDHTSTGAMRDAEGVLPLMSHGGYVLFHDAFHNEVRDAIDQFIRKHQGAVSDLGLMTREVTTMSDEKGKETHWGGLRLVYIH